MKATYSTSTGKLEHITYDTNREDRPDRRLTCGPLGVKATKPR